MYTYRFMNLLNSTPFKNGISEGNLKASLCSYLPKLSLIFITHTSLNASIFLSQRSTSSR